MLEFVGKFHSNILIEKLSFCKFLLQYSIYFCVVNGLLNGGNSFFWRLTCNGNIHFKFITYTFFFFLHAMLDKETNRVKFYGKVNSQILYDLSIWIYD